MRIAGMISAILVLIAVLFGLYSLSASFGFGGVQIFQLLWPVAIGVVVMTFVLLGLGRWSVNALNKDERSAANMKTKQHDAGTHSSSER